MLPHLEALFRLHDDAVAHLRHLEGQRSAFASVLLAVAGAVVAFGLPGGAAGSGSGAGLVLAGIGLFGMLLSWKQNEKISYHRRVSERLRSAIEADPLLAPQAIAAMREHEDRANRRRYFGVSVLPVGLFWWGLYVVIAAAGVAIAWNHGGAR